MQMSKRVNKTKHTVRPANKPHDAKTRFAKPNKVRQKKQKQNRVVFDDLTQLKDKMEEAEMRMGGTSVNASKIINAIQPKAMVDENVQTLNAAEGESVIVGEDLRSTEGDVDMTTGSDVSHTEGDDILAAKSNWTHEEAEEVLEPEVNATTTTRKLGLFGALCLGMRHTLVGQVVTAVSGR